ncbi:MAG: hypothetical protein IJK42_12045 [Prevotella sp.]|nr:hypothetical protein [Prevotella sp.]MBQ6210481.1 hypothetical protein [Prevotella sp.]
MSNKRILKRTINNVFDILVSECIATSLYDGKHHGENLNALISSIFTMRNDLISRISHPEPGMKQREYYKNLIADFHKDTNEIIDQISNLIA